MRTWPATRMLSGLPRFQTYFDFRFCTGQHLRLATKLRPQWRSLKKFRHSIFVGTTGIYCTRVYPSSGGRGWRRKSAGQVSPQSGHQGGWVPPLHPPWCPPCTPLAPSHYPQRWRGLGPYQTLMAKWWRSCHTLLPTPSTTDEHAQLFAPRHIQQFKHI